MTDTFRALCAELLQGLDENRHPEVRYPGHLRTIMAHARARLAQPEPAVEVSDEEIKDIAKQRVHGHKSLEWAIKQGIALDRSRRPQAEQAGEVIEAVAQVIYEQAMVYAVDTARQAPGGQAPAWEHHGNSNAQGVARETARACIALARSRRAQPVPVSERLQQMEDLAADAVSALRYIEQSYGLLFGVGWDRVYEKADRLLPAHALPLPAGEVQP